MEIDQKQLRELMRALKQFDVHEIELEKDGERIYLRRGADSTGTVIHAAPSAGSVPPPPAAFAEAHAPSGPPAHTDANVTPITSPFVGTFYRQPSPDAPSFVDVGQEIRPGQVLCIVEAMKLMNEIESEIAGTIVEVVAVNGKPVEYGDVLFKVRKSGS
jgi:acetyl-CoA carboxylase biotin carboxyl carrier protein